MPLQYWSMMSQYSIFSTRVVLCCHIVFVLWCSYTLWGQFSCWGWLSRAKAAWLQGHEKLLWMSKTPASSFSEDVWQPELVFLLCGLEQPGNKLWCCRTNLVYLLLFSDLFLLSCLESLKNYCSKFFVEFCSHAWWKGKFPLFCDSWA